MLITLHPKMNAVRLESENSHDVFKLGRLSASLEGSKHFSGSTPDGHTLQCTPEAFLELSLEACGIPEPIDAD